jgi:putative transcriptional regulator
MPAERHPSQQLRAAYRAGDTSPGTALALSVHAERCPVCRVDMQTLVEAARDERASGGRSRRSRTKPAAPIDGVESRALAELQQSPWRWLAPGVRAAELHGASGLGEAVCLLKLAPGATLPARALPALSQIVVLGGALRDGGESFPAGDYIEIESQPLTRPVADRPDGCLCLVVTDGSWPGRGFAGLVSRLRGREEG